MDQAQLPTPVMLLDLFPLIGLKTPIGIPEYSESREWDYRLREVLDNAEKLAFSTGRQIDLCIIKFHKSLYRFKMNDYPMALDRLQEAYGFATANKWLSCLILFAQALVLHGDLKFDEAAARYKSVINQIKKLRESLEPRNYSPEEENYFSFLHRLNEMCKIATWNVDNEIRQEMDTKLTRPRRVF